jgi:DNA-binding transcriptional LysR family regulator
VWYGRRRAVPVDELVATVLALPRRGSGTLDVVEAALAPFEFAAGGDRLEVASSAAARLSALNGPAVAFLTRCRAAADLASGALSVVPIGGLVVEQPVRVVWRGARAPAGSARRLVDALRAAV